jgi:hypothetical protein
MRFLFQLFRFVSISFLISALSSVTLHADWLTDGGYYLLQSELGSALPTGAGIQVLQTEADEDPDTGIRRYLPQSATSTPFAGGGVYTGKTFTAESSTGNLSNHSNDVAFRFYGNTGSAAPGVTDVHVKLADDFFNVLQSGSAPAAQAGLVHNHSWVAGTSGSTSSDNYILRAMDFMINRDGLVSCVPLNNGSGSTVPTFLPNTYNSISVGLRSGDHSRGGSTADGTGRMKPDLVVEQIYTSFASPAVASTAAMLLEKIKASYSAADHPQAVKAMLLAGASKTNLPAWTRVSSATPYHTYLGAGELNMLNAYHILVADRQQPSVSVERNHTGWDYNTASNTTARRYFFTVPEGRYANTFSVALTWHRSVGKSGFQPYSSSLPNLSLKLFAANEFTVDPTPIDQSLSTLDNVEHVFQRNLPPGQYAIEVTSNTNSINYGLAWEAQLGSGPTLTVSKDTNGNVFVNSSNIDPFATYKIQQSTTLTTWSEATTFRTADTTPSTTRVWQDPEAPMPEAKFYKLEWTAVR